MLYISAYAPPFIHIHGNESSIDARIFNDLLHDGLTTALH